MYMKDKNFSVRVRLSSFEFEFLQKQAEVHNSTMSSELRDCIWHAMLDNEEYMEKMKNGNI